ncbi:hypothetical protein KR018_009352, partial [Drosophila ironensis]
NQFRLKMFLPLLLTIALPWKVWAVAGTPPSPLARIIGGSSVEITEVPYQAAIIVDGSNVCSGAIIKESYVLTAASCVSGYSKSSVKVRVGSSSIDSGGTSEKVCNVITHPEYTCWRYDNNLAILKLCKPLKFSDTIKAIAIADKVPDDDHQVEVSGWGSTSWWGSWFDRCCSSRPSHLQRATTLVYNRESCKSDREPCLSLWDNGISDRIICTWDSDAGACSYDVGAPLVREGKLVGILSEGGCTSNADVFANIIEFQKWLSDNTKDGSTTTT